MRARSDRLHAKRTALLAACLLGTAVVVATHSAGNPTGPSDSLRLAPGDGLKIVRVRWNTFLGVYHRILLDPVRVSFDQGSKLHASEILQATRVTQVERTRIRSKLAAQVRNEFAKDIGGNGGYPLVDAPGPGVLGVHAEIVDLNVKVPSFLATGGAGNELRSPTHMTLIVELYDSQTGRLIARVVDREANPDIGRLAAAKGVSISATASRAVDAWAHLLRWGLDGAHSPAGATPSLG